MKFATMIQIQVSADEIIPGKEEEITLPPSKKMCMGVEFTLPNDKYNKHLPDPFPFPTNYPPMVECAIKSKTMMPKSMD